MKIHVGDNVLMRAGKYRKKTGKVLRLSKKHSTVVVEKMNIRTRHIKKRPGQPGQKIHYEAPVDASNLALICPHCSKATRVGYIKLKTGKKQRICKKCSQSLDTAEQRKQSKK